jgi:hypothetical protein
MRLNRKNLSYRNFAYFVPVQTSHSPHFDLFIVLADEVRLCMGFSYDLSNAF